MAKSQMQKAKLLYLLDYLKTNSDEEHAVTTRELIDALEANGIHADRKTIYADIEELCNYGYDILKRESRSGGGYYLAGREFELPELKLLVDAVQATRFITQKKSRELIHKLEGLTSRFEAGKLQRQVYVAGRSKAENEGIYYNVDAIHRAIQEDRQLRFLYLSWTPEKRMLARKDGKVYQVSPWALIWQEENYYLAAFDAEAGCIKHYRVDKMGSVELTAQEREGKDCFEKLDVAIYANQTFGMFGGETKQVTLRMKEELSGVILDRFGKEVPIRRLEEGWIQVRLTVNVSRQFFGWLTGLGTDACLTAPSQVREQYREFLKALSEQYVDEMPL